MLRKEKKYQNVGTEVLERERIEQNRRIEVLIVNKTVITREKQSVFRRPKDPQVFDCFL